LSFFVVKVDDGMKKIILLVLLAVCCLAGAGAAQRKNSRAAAGNTAGSVTLSNFKFAPQTVTVKAGGTVTWMNKEGTHTVSADDGSWESPTLTAGQSYSHQFSRPGTYRYHCSFHGSPGHDMAGVVTVKARTP
jgi:plastocyanin